MLENVTRYFMTNYTGCPVHTRLCLMNDLFFSFYNKDIAEVDFQRSLRHLEAEEDVNILQEMVANIDYIQMTRDLDPSYYQTRGLFSSLLERLYLKFSDNQTVDM